MKQLLSAGVQSRTWTNTKSFQLPNFSFLCIHRAIKPNLQASSEFLLVTPRPPRNPFNPSNTKIFTSKTMSTTVGNPTALSDRDVNVSPTKASFFGSASEDSFLTAKAANKASITSDSGDMQPRSLEHHRQVLHKRLEAERSKPPTYISPSDTIMSPCTAKLSAYKNKHFLKAKPQSLFAKMDAQKKEAKPAAVTPPNVATAGEMLEQQQGEIEQQEEDRV